MTTNLCWLCGKHPIGANEHGLCSYCAMVSGLAALHPRYADGGAVVFTAIAAYAEADGSHIQKSAVANAIFEQARADLRKIREG